MKTSLKNLVIPLLLAICVNSCTQEFVSPSQDPDPVLGKKLQNPYSLTVMQAAWDNLSDQGLLNSKKVILEPTHYYVKFKPKNEKELDLLLYSDTTVHFYTYPLDYEIPRGLKNYRDPEVPDGQPTYMYAAVKIDYEFTDVKYKILDLAFIPEDAVASTSGRSYLGKPEFSEIKQLFIEAMTLTDNEQYLIPEEEDDDGGGGGSGCSYCPQGTMRIWDDVEQGFVPLRGLEVKARVFLNTKSAFTDINGRYVIWHNFSSAKQYSFEWKRYDFVVRDGFLHAAETVGPKTTGWWSEDFLGGLSEYHGTIFRAAHHYYYQDISGVRRPPQNSFFGNSVKIRANNEAGRAFHAPALRFVLSSSIQIYGPERTTDNTYSTVIHELAHASHWGMGDNNDYNFCDDIVAESYAMGIEWVLSRMTYPNFTQNYWRAQAGANEDQANYTGLVEDLIDGQVDYDNVEGYTMRQIEDALIGIRTWGLWELNLDLRYENNTEDNLDELFDYWN